MDIVFDRAQEVVGSFYVEHNRLPSEVVLTREMRKLTPENGFDMPPDWVVGVKDLVRKPHSITFEVTLEGRHLRKQGMFHEVFIEP